MTITRGPGCSFVSWPCTLKPYLIDKEIGGLGRGCRRGYGRGHGHQHKHTNNQNQQKSLLSILVVFNG